MLNDKREQLHLLISLNKLPFSFKRRHQLSCQTREARDAQLKLTSPPTTTMTMQTTNEHVDEKMNGTVEAAPSPTFEWSPGKHPLLMLRAEKDLQ